jgi:hypothetical protein
MMGKYSLQLTSGRNYYHRCRKNAFSSIEFDKDRIFDTFKYSGREHESTLVCKVYSKSLSHLFKNVKKVIHLNISIDDSDDSRPELVFEFMYESNILKTDRMNYQDVEFLNPIFDEDVCSRVNSEPTVFIRLFDHVKHSLEVIVEVSSTSFRLKSFHQQISSTASSNKATYMTSDIGSPIEAFDMFELVTEGPEEMIFSIKEV